MLNELVLKALNDQMTHELSNSLIYKSFSDVADYLGFTGASSWFEKQSQEEYKHHEKIRKYILDMGSIPILGAIPMFSPPLVSLYELFSQVLILETSTTDKLKNISEICKEVKDDQTYELILWFLKEQIEEERNVDTIIKRLNISSNNILLIDKELGER